VVKQAYGVVSFPPRPKDAGFLGDIDDSLKNATITVLAINRFQKEDATTGFFALLGTTSLNCL
jgi:hypothetical protein